LNPTVAHEVSSDEVLMNPIEYRKRLAPVYLRRKREDVLHDLPDKIEKEDWCTMTDVDERDYLAALRQGSFSAMRRVGWRHTDMDHSAKAARLLEICDEARENGDKILVFSFYLDTINKVARLVGDQCAGVINGGVSGPERQGIVDEFSSSDKSVLVAQVIAGGVGLNIQAANVVVFCEPQIKPSIEDQAISRAYRMGQPKAVMVHRLYMDQTVDEKIKEILARKRRDFDMYADKSEIGRQSLKVIDTDAIMQIIQEERKRHGIDPNLPVNAKDSAKSDT
jgi:SNF2 family DNA or RNA helicase